MPRRPPQLSASAAELKPVFAALRERLDVPGDFPGDALAEAEQAAADAPTHELDRTDLAMVTIDPPGSMDLDQALHLARRGSGFRIHYAIADVGSFVTPGGALDRCVHDRGVTHYGPDERAPLHPNRLGEDAASLLPGRTRPAMLWQLDLDAHGQLDQARLRRAMVRSRARHTYEEVAEALDRGVADDMLALLPLVGEARREVEQDRGGIALPLPDQEIVKDGAGYHLELRRPLPVEQDNAQLSLLTGIAAASIMRAGRVGIQRTLPPADQHTIDRLRATARGLGIDWPSGMSFPEVVRTLDPDRAAHAAFLDETTVAFRGSGYRAYDGSRPADVTHGGIAADYAHVTAPLRRLVDRHGLEICHALTNDHEVPDWVTGQLYELPEIMRSTTTRADRYEREAVDVVEAALLADQAGKVFSATVIDLARDGSTGRVVLPDFAVRSSVEGADLELGQQIEVRVRSTNVSQGKIDLERV